MVFLYISIFLPNLASLFHTLPDSKKYQQKNRRQLLAGGGFLCSISYLFTVSQPFCGREVLRPRR